jgi:uncharacterized membrane protein
MSKNRKELKLISILILVLVAVTFIRVIVDACLNGIYQFKEIPNGMTEDMMKVRSIIAFVLSFAMFFPQIYVGVKGLELAKDSTKGKAHIVLVVILIIVFGVSAISGVVSLAKNFDSMKLLEVFDAVADVALFGCYYVYARRVEKEN